MTAMLKADRLTVFEKGDEVGLGSLLERSNGGRLESD